MAVAVIIPAIWIWIAAADVIVTEIVTGILTETVIVTEIATETVTATEIVTEIAIATENATETVTEIAEEKDANPEYFLLSPVKPVAVRNRCFADKRSARKLVSFGHFKFISDYS